ncbi:MAG: YjbH domain-containing protein [Bacteroidota bacterium]
MKLKGGLIFPIVFSVVIFSISGRPQSVSGVPGYVRIPIATFNKDGSMYFGTSFLPQKHLSYSHFNYDGIAVYASLTFLSFVEVDLRITRQINIPAGWSHVVDRVPTIRFRILKEKKWVPAVAFGFHDVITSLESGAARHFGASYLVVTKNFHLAKLHLNIGTTAGWGASNFIWKNNEFIGPFGGCSIGSDKLTWMNLLFDYDGETFNTGLRFICFKHLFLTAATMNFDSFTGTISYQFNLIR